MSPTFGPQLILLNGNGKALNLTCMHNAGKGDAIMGRSVYEIYRRQTFSDKEAAYYYSVLDSNRYVPAPEDWKEQGGTIRIALLVFEAM